MIVCDTTAVNTGSKNGVVVRLQGKFQDLGIETVYIGCQHHILDRVLKHVFDQLFGESSASPDINYPFVTNILQNYEHLKEAPLPVRGIGQLGRRRKRRCRVAR